MKSGDIAVDVGANIGHYTVRWSSLVGTHGRVIALEPVMDTVAILASVIANLPLRNVTLIGSAANDVAGLCPLDVPSTKAGLQNFYQAHISRDTAAMPDCLAVRLVDLLEGLPRIALIKIDAEGADSSVLRGARGLIAKHPPLLIIESIADGETRWPTGCGYREYRAIGSPNRVYVHTGDVRDAQ